MVSSLPSPFLSQSLSLCLHSFVRLQSCVPILHRRADGVHFCTVGRLSSSLHFIQSERPSFLSSQTTMPVTMRNARKQAISFSFLKDILLPFRSKRPLEQLCSLPTRTCREHD
jgi:hypothetical protein